VRIFSDQFSCFTLLSVLHILVNFHWESFWFLCQIIAKTANHLDFKKKKLLLDFENFMIYVNLCFLGLPLVLAIALHNIPEGAVVFSPVYTATKSKSTAFLYTFVSALCEPFGALVFGFLFREYLTKYVVKISLGCVAGSKSQFF